MVSCRDTKENQEEDDGQEAHQENTGVLLEF
jgi:hypothetical protein